MNKIESKTLEYKEDITNTFLKTVSAFANYQTGKIIFGVDDNGKVKGLSNIKEKCLIIENKINDCINPIPKYLIDIDENKKIIILTVFESEYKPYFYKNKAYKRSHSSTICIDRNELNRLILNGLNKNYEDLDSSNQNLEFKYLKEKLKESLNIENFNMDILKTLDLYSEPNGFNIAGELLADKNSLSGVDIIVFGKNINEFNDRETIINTSIIKQFDLALDVYKKYYQYELLKGSKRVLKDRVPEIAFREALANAIVHREWDINSNIKISMYEDKIEIASPGSLPYGLSKEEYLNGQVSNFRNPKISNVFFRLKYIEKFGTGVSRIINSYKDEIKKPEFYFYENSIKVVLPTIDNKENKFDSEELLILDLLKTKKLSRKQIENFTEINKSKLIRLINNLIKINMIKKIGSGKMVKYTSI